MDPPGDGFIPLPDGVIVFGFREMGSSLWPIGATGPSPPPDLARDGFIPQPDLARDGFIPQPDLARDGFIPPVDLAPNDMRLNMVLGNETWGWPAARATTPGRSPAPSPASP